MAPPAPPASLPFALQSLNTIWTGFRYAAMFWPERIPDLDVISANSLGITAIQLPGIQVVEFRVPSLSTKQSYVPREVQFSNLSLTAPVSRNRTFYNKLKTNLDSIGTQFPVTDTIVITEFNGTVEDAILPLAVWACTGCRCTGLQPANISAEATSIPLDVATFRVNGVYRFA